MPQCSDSSTTPLPLLLDFAAAMRELLPTECLETVLLVGDTVEE